VDLTYLISGSNRGRDSYTGLDRFGRIVDQRWLRSGDGSAVERLQYTYDRNGNRLSRVNLLNAELSESYSYDDLNQLISFTRGEHSRSWDYDAQGNWQSVVTDGNVQTRTHNAQNEITGISGAVLPTYDANGNLTRDETGRQFVYDAWNRLVEVRDGSGETVKRYAYDGLHRRISETADGVTTDFYYSEQWQVLEERVGGNTTVQYVWSPVYVDALVLRDRDTDGDGTLDERLWVVQDANFNVTALLDDSGEVVERYIYDPFGQAAVLDAEWNVRTGGSAYDWLHLHQGGRYDVTSGLYHFRFRDYSPTLGRWTSLDPLSYAAGDVNLYRTVGNNPLNSLDPSGLDRIDQIEVQGQVKTVWYVDERLFRDDPRHYVGRLVIVNGEQFVCRRVGNQEYYVPLAKVEELTSYWSWEPTERSEWDNWFIQYGVTNPNAQRLPTPTTPNFYLFGQPSYWPWSKGASLSLWENIKHIGRMVPVAGAGVVGGGLSGAGMGALCGGGGGAIPGALGGAASGLIAAAFAKDPAEAFAYGFAGGILGGGATAAATRFAASRAAGQAAAGNQIARERAIQEIQREMREIERILRQQPNHPMAEEYRKWYGYLQQLLNQYRR
jgi:RHS repeat-associated protein